MEPQLGLHELLHVFSFLEARDLLCAAQVDKVVRPGPGGRQGRVHGHWLVHGWSVPSRPVSQIWEGACGGPESARNQQRALLAPGVVTSSAFEGFSQKTSHSSVPPSVCSVSRAPAGLSTGYL